MYFKLIFITVIPGVVLTGLPQKTSVTGNNITVLKNATIIDCKGKYPVTGQVLILKDSLIADIGILENFQLPAEAKVIDLRGKFIMPGLIDYHAHVAILGRKNDKRFFDEQTSQKVLLQLLKHGITTVRNPAAPNIEGIQLREDIKNGNIKGPAIFTSGRAIQFSRIHRQADLWEVYVTGKEEAIAEVNIQADCGVDIIKIYSSVPPDITKAIIEQAHSRHIPVAGHFGQTNWTEAAKLGANGFEHGTDWSQAMLPIDKRKPYADLINTEGAMKARIKWLEWIDVEGKEVTDMIRLVKRNQIVIDPTLIAYATKFMGNDSVYIASPAMNAVSELLENWKKGTFVDDWTDQNFQDGHKYWPKMLRLIKRYYDAGIILVVGSDIPNPWVIPGISLYQEMKFFSDAGIPNYDILKMCTVNGAAGLGILNRMGTIEKGKIADLIILNRNPVEDITNISSVYAVLKGGAVTCF